MDNIPQNFVTKENRVLEYKIPKIKYFQYKDPHIV